MKVNDTSFNILLSYAYLGNGQKGEFWEYIKEKSMQGEVDIMIDSGGFTKHTMKLKGSNRFDWLTMDSYCRWLHQNEKYVHKYVMLDKIRDEEQSQINYHDMLKDGLNPMYVWTTEDTNIEHVIEGVENNHEICVAGGTKKSNYILRKYQDAYKFTDGKANIHSLGYFQFPTIYQLPILSSDAATWVNASGLYGNCFVYTGNGCLKVFPGWKYFYNGLKKRDKYLIQTLKECRIGKDDLLNRDNLKGNQIPLMLGSYVYTKVQQYAWRLKKLRLYLSGAQSFSFVRSLEYMNEHIKDNSVDFHEWRDYTWRKQK